MNLHAVRLAIALLLVRLPYTMANRAATQGQLTEIMTRFPLFRELLVVFSVSLADVDSFLPLQDYVRVLRFMQLRVILEKQDEHTMLWSHGMCQIHQATLEPGGWEETVLECLSVLKERYPAEYNQFVADTVRALQN